MGSMFDDDEDLGEIIDNIGTELKATEGSAGELNNKVEHAALEFDDDDWEDLGDEVVEATNAVGGLVGAADMATSGITQAMGNVVSSMENAGQAFDNLSNIADQATSNLELIDFAQYLPDVPKAKSEDAKTAINSLAKVMSDITAVYEEAVDAEGNVTRKGIKLTENENAALEEMQKLVGSLMYNRLGYNEGPDVANYSDEAKQLLEQLADGIESVEGLDPSVFKTKLIGVKDALIEILTDIADQNKSRLDRANYSDRRNGISPDIFEAAEMRGTISKGMSEVLRSAQNSAIEAYSPILNNEQLRDLSDSFENISKLLNQAAESGLDRDALVNALGKIDNIDYDDVYERILEEIDPEGTGKTKDEDTGRQVSSIKRADEITTRIGDNAENIFKTLDESVDLSSTKTIQRINASKIAAEKEAQRKKDLDDVNLAIAKSNNTDADALRKRAAIYKEMAEEAEAAGKAIEAAALYKKQNTDINKANKLDKPVDVKPSAAQKTKQTTAKKTAKESKEIKDLQKQFEEQKNEINKLKSEGTPEDKKRINDLEKQLADTQGKLNRLINDSKKNKADNRASINAKAEADRTSRERIAESRKETKDRELAIRERAQDYKEQQSQKNQAKSIDRKAIADKEANVINAGIAVKSAQNTDERIAAYNDLISAIEAKIETLRDLLAGGSEVVSNAAIAKEEKNLNDAQQALRQTLDGVSSEVVDFTKNIKDRLDKITKDSSLSTEEKAREVGKLKSELSSSTNRPVYNDADLAAYKEITEQVDAANEKLIKQSAIEDTNRQMAYDVARLEREVGEASTTGDRVAKHRELAEVYRQQAAAVEDLTKREVLLKRATDEDAKAARLLEAEERSLANQAKSAMSEFTNIVGMVNAATNKVIGWIRTAVSLENKGINMTVSGARTVVSSLGRVVQLFGNLANRVRSCIAAVVRFAQTATRALRTILSGVGRLIRGFGSLIGNVRRLITNFGSLSRSVRETKAFSLAFTELNSAISLAERAYNGLFNNQLLEKAFKFDSTIASITMLLGEEATNDTREYASALQDAFGLSFTQTISDLQEITSLLKAAGLEASGISGVQLANAAQDFSAISNYLAALGMAGGNAQEVMSKLESGLKGMTQSIDDLGLSVRENDLNEFLKNKGYNIKFSGLSEANKETVRLAAIIQQFKDSFSIGNYASLLDQTYYRVAVIKSQVEEIRTIIGKIFEGIVAKILPVILLVVNSIRKALEGLAVKLDIDIKGNDIQDSLSDIADGMENVEGKEKDAAKAAKEFDGAAGFDELESLNTNSGDSDLNLSKLLADVGSISDALEEAAKNSGSLFDRAAEEVHAKLEELKEKWTAFVDGKLGKGVDPFFGFNWESAKKSLGNIKGNIERWWTSFSETGLTLALKIANDAQVGRLVNDVLKLIDSLTKLAAILQEQIAPIIEDFYDKHIAKLLGVTSDEIHKFVKDFKKSVNELDKNLKSGMSFKDAFNDAFELDNPDSRFGKIAKTIGDITAKISEIGNRIDTIYRLYLRPMLSYASRILGDIWNLYLKPLLGDGGAFSIDSFLNDIINKEKKIVGILENEQFQLEFHSNINALFDDVKTTLDNIKALAAGGFTIAGSIFSKDNGGQSLFELVSANYQKFSTDTLQPWIEETSKSVADYIEKHKQEIANFVDMITNELFGVVDKIVELAGKFAAYNIEHPEMLKSIGDEANKVLQFISDNFDTIMAIVSYVLQVLMASIDGLMAGLQTIFDKFNELNTKNEGEDKSSIERIIDRICEFIKKIWKDLGKAIANLMQWAADNEGLLNGALTAIEDISGFFSEHVIGVINTIIGIKTVSTAIGVVTSLASFFTSVANLISLVSGSNAAVLEIGGGAFSIGTGALALMAATVDNIFNEVKIIYDLFSGADLETTLSDVLHFVTVISSAVSELQTKGATGFIIGTIKGEVLNAIAEKLGIRDLLHDILVKLGIDDNKNEVGEYSGREHSGGGGKDGNSLGDTIVAGLNEVKDAIFKQDSKAEVDIEFHPDTSKAGVPTNIPVKIRALGGSVPSGNLFIANEAGNPELIGKIGRSTGTDIANRGMITEAMEAAVYNGMVDAINNSRSVSSSSNNESANINISGFGIIDKTTLKKLASMLAPYLDGNKQALTV